VLLPRNDLSPNTKLRDLSATATHSHCKAQPALIIER
jgi:hypothetical protein